MQLQANRSRSFSPQFGIPGVPGKGRCNSRNKGTRAKLKPPRKSVRMTNDGGGESANGEIEYSPDPTSETVATLIPDLADEMTATGKAYLPTLVHDKPIQWGKLEWHTIPELKDIAANCIPPIKVPRVGKPAIIAAIRAALGSMDL